MKLLILGSGGREHTLCWLLRRSSLVDQVFCAPGNAGISSEATCIPLDLMDFIEIKAFCKTNNIDLVVVGPEAPLVAGIVDYLEKEGIPCFGPSADAAKLEGSKIFMKELCEKVGVPTAKWAKFNDHQSALSYIEAQTAPIVVKADGLAAGKGVVVAETIEEAKHAAKSMFEGIYGEAGLEVIVEECLVGEEASFFAIADGKTVLPLATAQDHKRIGEGDTGPNTGGMGAYSPAPVLTEEICKESQETIIEPLIAALSSEGIEFKGVFYAGLMITEDGPKLLEVNVRFGDPECQALLPRLKTDLLPVLFAARDGELENITLQWRDEVAVCVVMSSAGYPGNYKTGSIINGLNNIRQTADSMIFHAGTQFHGENIIASGGRVLGITALGNTVKLAQRKAYELVDKIDWPDGYCRRDIGWRAIEDD
tara:strand:+ start:25351 stop:26622 length:1272 start_codon:yes stop_codon:yes gene_type:complete